MQLILVRHGQATTEDVDPKRPLTESGKADVANVARFLKRSGISTSTAWHSAKTRAAETAHIIAGVLGVQNLQEFKSGLNPNDKVTKVSDEITAFSLQADGDLMIVGHLPFLPKLVSYLLTSSESIDAVKFPEAGAVCLEQSDEDTWQVKWMINPDLLEGSKPYQ